MTLILTNKLTKFLGTTNFRYKDEDLSSFTSVNHDFTAMMILCIIKSAGSGL